jgi:hypothetical protein
MKRTTWNLEWFPNGSAHEATPEVQAQRIAAAGDVLRPINPDIILLQEVRDYDVCVRLGEAIALGVYHVAICSAFKERFQSGLGKQQVAILSKYQAQAAWVTRQLVVFSAYPESPEPSKVRITTFTIRSLVALVALAFLSEKFNEAFHDGLVTNVRGRPRFD